VLAGGTLLMGLYVKPTPTAKWVTWVLAWNGSAWTARGTVAIPGRDAAEPQLVQLAGGDLLLLMRSDAPSPYYCYLYKAVSGDGGHTWATPVPVVTHGTGMPVPFRLPTGEIAVLYRGFLSVPPSAASPLRMAMLDASGTTYRSGIDPAPGDLRLWLYGGVIPGVDSGPDLLVASFEGPDAMGPYAEVQVAPLTWATY
jgi:hypothetical protein